jgi:hypothetical protein
LTYYVKRQADSQPELGIAIIGGEDGIGHARSSCWVSPHLKWEVITPEYHNTYADLVEAANFGAAAVGMLMARQFVGEQRFMRSVIGTGFDYWLGNSDSRGIFQGHARLEVSGILKGGETLIRKRIREKLHQTRRSDHTALPAFVAVVEFSSPHARFLKKPGVGGTK